MAQRTHGTQGAQDLSGEYELSGFFGRTLHSVGKPDVSLGINDTRRTGSGAARYVTVTVGGFPAKYGGNLYGADRGSDAKATEELDGCQFQDEATKVRYCISQTGTDRFTVSPVSTPIKTGAAS